MSGSRPEPLAVWASSEDPAALPPTVKIEPLAWAGAASWPWPSYADDDPVREHHGAARDGASVSAGFADDGRRLAGDGGFVHAGQALDDVAVAGDQIPSFADDDVPHFEVGAVHQFLVKQPVTVPACAGCTGRHQGPGPASCHDGGACGTETVCLGLATALGDGLGEVSEQYGPKIAHVAKTTAILLSECALMS